jgi:hypothetical protein
MRALVGQDRFQLTALQAAQRPGDQHDPAAAGQAADRGLIIPPYQL